MSVLNKIQTLLSTKASKAELEAALAEAAAVISKTGSNGSAKKRGPVISRDDFLNHAKNLPVTVGGVQGLTATVKEFSTGSYGWNCSGKLQLEVNGQTVDVQVGMNLTVLGSKPKAKVDEAVTA